MSIELWRQDCGDMCWLSWLSCIDKVAVIHVGVKGWVSPILEWKKTNFLTVFENFYGVKIWRVRWYMFEETGEFSEKERKKFQNFSKYLKLWCWQDLLSLLIRVKKTWWFLLIRRKKKLSFVDTSKEKYEFYRYIERKGWVFSIGAKMWVAPIHVVKKLWFLLICWKKKVSSSTCRRKSTSSLIGGKW